MYHNNIQSHFQQSKHPIMKNHTFILIESLKTSQYNQTQQIEWLPTIFFTYLNIPKP